MLLETIRMVPEYFIAQLAKMCHNGKKLINIRVILMRIP